MDTNRLLQPSLKYAQFPEIALRKSLTNSCFQRLPLDLISQIFSYLNQLRDVKHVRLSSRIFYKLSEKHLVKVLAERLEVPIKINTTLDEFKSVAKLRIMLNDFFYKNCEFCLYSFSGWIPWVHVHSSKSHSHDYDKIVWHLLVNQNSDQPFIRNSLVLLDHQHDMPTQKIAVIAMLYLPAGVWLGGVRNDSNGDWLDCWKTNDGQILFENKAPPHIRRKDNMWRVSYG